ncbi:olfactory receptor 5AR1-like [Rhinophrynus dorsalis]
MWERIIPIRSQAHNPFFLTEKQNKEIQTIKIQIFTVSQICLLEKSNLTLWSFDSGNFEALDVPDDSPQVQAIIFILVLFIYLLTLGGNVTILFLIFSDPRLHTPMYFFLCNLSSIDIMYTTVTLHRIFYTFISGDNKITFQDCFTQLYFFISLAPIELLILTAMSYDRYVAICNPLHYHIVMNHKVCIVLATICWVFGFLETVPLISIVYGFSCYKSRVINHFFCDMLALMKIFCSDTSLLEHTILAVAVFADFTPFLLTLVSYICIISTILKIPSASGRQKTFYTCSSHLTVVILFYVTISCLYLRPTSMFSMDSDKWFAFLYTAIVPMLNPLIYSLKNKDVKSALSGVLKTDNTAENIHLTKTPHYVGEDHSNKRPGSQSFFPTEKQNKDIQTIKIQIFTYFCFGVSILAAVIGFFLVQWTVRSITTRDVGSFLVVERKRGYFALHVNVMNKC